MAPAVGFAIAGIAGAVASGVAARSASRASRAATQAQTTSTGAALQFEREREAEAQRQFDAEEAFRESQFAAQEEQRLYERRLQEEREARAAPYRQASQDALQQLRDFFDLPRGAAPPMPRDAERQGAILPGTSDRMLSPFSRRIQSNGEDWMRNPNIDAEWANLEAVRRPATSMGYRPVNDPRALSTFLRSQVEPRRRLYALR